MGEGRGYHEIRLQILGVREISGNWEPLNHFLINLHAKIKIKFIMFPYGRLRMNSCLTQVFLYAY